VTTVRELLAAADRQQQEARNSYRALAADLRAAGLSVPDTAVILGVSRGRVSQLSKASYPQATLAKLTLGSDAEELLQMLAGDEPPAGDAILQPPKPEIQPFPQLPERATDRDADLDEVYGSCTQLREFFEQRGQAYVLRPGSPLRRPGSKGERWYAWVWIATASPRHQVLARRHLRTGELAFHYCYVPEGQNPAKTRLIRAAGLRWQGE
jgi:hypothetical protein